MRSKRYFDCDLESWKEFDNKEYNYKTKQYEYDGKVDVKDKEVIFARMRQESYEGYAQMIYQRKGKLYEVTGSHCSCYGFEGQWDPTEITWDQLAMRPAVKDPKSYSYDADLAAIVNKHVPRG